MALVTLRWPPLDFDFHVTFGRYRPGSRKPGRECIRTGGSGLWSVAEHERVERLFGHIVEWLARQIDGAPSAGFST